MRKLQALPRPFPPRPAAAPAALALLATLVAALASSPAAQAKPTRKIVTDVFAVTYDAKVTYQHHLALPEYRETQNVTYDLHGRLPEVTFVDGLLQVDQSATLDTTVRGRATIEAAQDDGDRLSCGGIEIKLRGIVGIGRGAKGIWFLPAHSAAPEGACVSTEGAHPPFDLTVPWPGAGNGLAGDKATGAKTFPVSARSIDVPRWSKPFRIAFADEKCPNYDPSMTISCSHVIQGKLTLTRVDRAEEVNVDPLLPALDPPKLNRQKTKATTTVECQSSCDVEALIGVFGGTPKHPKVTPLHKKKVHLAADKPVTISMPVAAADRAAARQGLLVMTLKAAGGKAQLYPLGGPAGMSRRAGAAAPMAPRAGAGAVRSLLLPRRATLRGGALTMLVSNPNGFRARGSLELYLGKGRLAHKGFALPARGERTIAFKLDPAARATLARQKAPRLSAVAGFRDPGGHLRRTSGTVVVSRAGGGAPAPNPSKPSPPPAEAPAGPDGTYHGSNGLTVLIAGGKVTAFNGAITTYCAKSEDQKNVSFGMFGDDPAPTVAADGSFAYEATTGYGFVKLKYEGRVSGNTATGNLVVEDRSPMSTGDGRLDFDYCFAGADWTATR
ncbi:MAG TPA: hypothetical protein VMF55_06340 [Solirubrobacterales bacterium]|nr:hypothetical protein [Solirubrobacterales bacterium]